MPSTDFIPDFGFARQGAADDAQPRRTSCGCFRRAAASSSTQRPILDIVEILIEQYMREFEYRLEHVDQLLKQAKRVCAQCALPSPAVATLYHVEVRRETLAQEFAHFRRSPPRDLQRLAIEGRALDAARQAIGYELERVLTALTEDRRRT